MRRAWAPTQLSQCDRLGNADIPATSSSRDAAVLAHQLRVHAVEEATAALHDQEASLDVGSCSSQL